MDPTAAKQPPHGIFELEPSSTLWMTELGLIVCLLLLIFVPLAFWFWRKRRKAKSPIIQDPWTLLGSRLNRVEWRETKPEDYFGALSRILREALERRQQRPFSAWTKAEVLREMQGRSEFSSDFQADCAEFLETAERVIYAAAPMDESAALAWKERVGRCLETLKREPVT